MATREPGVNVRVIVENAGGDGCDGRNDRGGDRRRGIAAGRARVIDAGGVGEALRIAAREMRAGRWVRASDDCGVLVSITPDYAGVRVHGDAAMAIGAASGETVEVAAFIRAVLGDRVTPAYRLGGDGRAIIHSAERLGMVHRGNIRAVLREARAHADQRTGTGAGRVTGEVWWAWHGIQGVDVAHAIGIVCEDARSGAVG